jgi:hypothetical protein
METGRIRLWAALATLLISSHAFGLHSYTPKRSTSRKVGRHHVRRVRWNPMFRPSHESLLRQNEEIDRLDLPRIQDDDELEALKTSQAPRSQSSLLPSLDSRLCGRPEPGLLSPVP